EFVAHPAPAAAELGRSATGGSLMAERVEIPVACPVVAASIETLSGAGGGLRSTASLAPLLGGDHEGDPLNGVGTRGLRPRGRGRQSGPGRDVEVRVRDRWDEANVHPGDQEGRGQTRRNDELAGPEGDRPQGPEAEGRHSDVLRRAEAHG